MAKVLFGRRCLIDTMMGMTKQLSPQEFNIYLELLFKAFRGVRSTLRLTYPEYVSQVTAVIELPRHTADEIQIFLLKSHQLAVTGRHDVYAKDKEASNLLDVIHNMPYGLLGRFDDGAWDWRGHLPDSFEQHEEFYLSGLKKYTGMLAVLNVDS